MLCSGNTVPAEPGMFFLHCMIADSVNGLAMSLGHTYLVTENGREVLSAPVGIDRGLAAFPCGKQTGTVVL
jgi:hypothetical protein